MNFSRHVYILALLVSLLSCGQGTKTGVTTDGDTIPLRYSRLLTIVRHGKYTEVLIADPWKPGNTLHKYNLATSRADAPADGTFVPIPLGKTLIFTAAHCWLMGQLGAENSVVGVCDKQYIMADWVKRLPDCGNAMNPNIEKIISLTPDAVILSPFQNSGGYGKVEQLGIPIIEAADYMEESALGRAEWMLFYGMLIGRQHEAEQLFHQVETQYKALMAQACRTTTSPKVMVDIKQSSSWYVPGGGSTLGKMIVEAGGRYAFSNDKRSGSIPLSVETMLSENHDADVWLIKYNSANDLTLGTLQADNASYAKFQAFAQGNVYGCNTSYVPYYEQVPFHPDWLLHDYIRILNSHTDSLRYYKKLATE